MENFPPKISYICNNFPLILILAHQTWKRITYNKKAILHFPLNLILDHQTWKIST